MKDKIYKLVPNVLQNLLIHIYNRKAYKIRYGGRYWEYRKEKEANRNMSLEELKSYQKKRYEKLLRFVIENSDYYRTVLSSIDNVTDLGNIRSLPILDKEKLRKNIDSVVVKTTERLEKSKTGGTTGKALEVKNFERNSQERFAFLDDFRSRYGYELGKKTAWFSGKALLTHRDIKRNRFWKTDPIYHVRYYSTFHIKDSFLKYYVEDMIKYKPEYLVGFPSTMVEIAKFGLNNGYSYPKDTIRAVFPTAETITDESRFIIETFFNTKLYNQYASSEGAPFIFECERGNLHLELQSGVFEVLDHDDIPAQAGRLVVTSFTNEGTPLIRYDIGDSIILEEEHKICSCGNNNPLVREILGRVDDFLYSPENGKINLGNLSNTLKDTKGIIRFQGVQNQLDKIELLVVVDPEIYSKDNERIFVKNWRERIGNGMELAVTYVDEIPVEKSGKYRIIKNNIKNLL